VDKKADLKPDKKADKDLGESVSKLEPMLIEQASRHRGQLTDLALELAQRSSGFRHSLPQSLLSSLADLVRSMNCYYSNLIEGHYTHPIDIERALRGDYSQDAKKRDLQLEAKAHIEVQQWIDKGGLRGRAATSSSAILEIHRRFCSHLPDDLLWVDDTIPGQRFRVIPGGLRQHNVRVGRHIPISSPAVPRFLERFEQVYSQLGKAETIIAAAAAHHRLVWIHPFLDGNGRVARLMSHAMLLGVLDTGGIWSIARGLGRNADAYKSHLANCDQKRRNDFDGRGHLSEEALVEFTRFFLEKCLDQVSFMQSLTRAELLRNRVVSWADEEIRLGKLPPKSNAILEAVLYRGELSRAETTNITGTGDRQARRIVSALINEGVLVSESIRSPLRLAFPATLAHRWMPGLFPENQEVARTAYVADMEQLKDFFRKSSDRFGNPEIIQVGKSETFDLVWDSEPPLRMRWTWDDPMGARLEPNERFFLACAFAGAHEYTSHVELRDGDRNPWLYVSTRYQDYPGKVKGNPIVRCLTKEGEWAKAALEAGKEFLAKLA
jgi:Fic family protein